MSTKPEAKLEANLPATPKGQVALPPTRKGKATRESLLLAAGRVFGRHGYNGARVADIVAEAGISHGLFYRHFADKDAILLAVLGRLNDNLRHTSGRHEENEAATSLEKLQHRSILFFNEYRQNRLMLRVAREAAARQENTNFRTMWLAIRGRFVDRTHYWLDRLIGEGRVSPIEDTAMIAEGLGALTEQMAYVQIGLADEDPDDEFIERLGKSCGLIWYRTIFGREK